MTVYPLVDVPAQQIKHDLNKTNRLSVLTQHVQELSGDSFEYPVKDLQQSGESFAYPEKDFQKSLLTDVQLAHFIKNGYLILQPTVSKGANLHSEIYEEAEKLVEDGECGNNFMEQLPSGLLDQIIDSPEVHGALTTILGDDFAIEAHKHCHVSQEGSVGQTLHQDDFFGFNRLRHLLPMELMVLYYPQAVTSEMGPTLIVPGSHLSDPSGQRIERRLTSHAPGMCVIMHYHLWHRGTLQTGGDRVPVRYMFKMQFRRTRPLPSSGRFPLTFSRNHNPFEQSAQESDADMICAAIWSALTGQMVGSQTARALETKVGSTGCNPGLLALAVAVRACSREDLCNRLEKQVRDNTIDLVDAGALQCLGRVSSRELALLVTTLYEALNFESLLLDPQHAHVGLELVSAIGSLLPPLEALPKLVALIKPSQGPSQVPRVQYHAFMAIYNCYMSTMQLKEWQSAVEAVELEQTLLDSVERLQAMAADTEFAEPCEDAGARYALSEAIRCILRFGSQNAVDKCLKEIEFSLQAEVSSSPEWRKTACKEVERRRRCPFSSYESPF